MRETSIADTCSVYLKTVLEHQIRKEVRINNKEKNYQPLNSQQNFWKHIMKGYLCWRAFDPRQSWILVFRSDVHVWSQFQPVACALSTFKFFLWLTSYLIYQVSYGFEFVRDINVDPLPKAIESSGCGYWTKRASSQIQRRHDFDRFKIDRLSDKDFLWCI